MPSIFDWSTTAGSNTTVDGVSIAEGMSPANVNNAMRSIMALCKSTFATALQSFLAGSAALPIANGGTAATTASAARTNLSALDSAYRDLDLQAKTGNFTFALTDVSKGVRFSGSPSVGTIDPYGTTPLPANGAVIPVRCAHNSAGALTVSPGGGVSLRLAGATTTSGSITFAIGSWGGIIQESQDNWIAYGTGVS